MLDGSADAAKVGAAARQAAVYVLALEQVAARLHPAPEVRAPGAAGLPEGLLNLPTAAAVDVRKQRAVTRRQLDRLTRIEDIAAALPEGTCFAPDLPTAEQLTAAVESVPATYAPECLAACELAFHCRARSRAEGAVTSLGRSVRAELGGLTTVEDVLAAAHGTAGDPEDPAVAALRRAADLRAEALSTPAARGRVLHVPDRTAPRLRTTTSRTAPPRTVTTRTAPPRTTTSRTAPPRTTTTAATHRGSAPCP